MSILRPSRLFRPAPVAGVIVCCLAASAPAAAELALLTNGDFLKVTDYELFVDEETGKERMRLELRNGGALTLDLRRIERIIDDEISPEPPPPTPLIGARETEPELELSWHETQAPQAGRHTEVISQVARDYDINAELMAAMARAESAFDAEVVSHKGARGLLQLMPATAERFGIRAEHLWDPLHNATASARYLRFLIDKFDGKLDLVLAGYNAGEGAVERYGGVPPYKETVEYVARIRGFLGLGDSRGS